MKMPRIFSNGIGAWSLLAILVLPAAGTFIVASEDFDTKQQGFAVGAATRFVVFDETSGRSEEPPPGQLVAPSAGSLDGDVQGPFPLEPPVAQAESFQFEPVSPVVRPAFAPSLFPSAEDVKLTANATGFRASDQVEDIGAREAVRQETDHLLPEQTESLPATASAETVSLAADASLEENDLAVENLAEAFAMEDMGDVSVPVDEVEPVEAASLPQEQVGPQGFTMGDSPVDATAVASQMLGEGQATPLNQVPALPNTVEQAAPPMLETAQLMANPTAADQVETDAVPNEVESNNAQPMPLPPVSPSPEAESVDQYEEFVPEDLYYPEPAMSADCGMACPRSWYARAELLYIDRKTEEGLTLTDDDFNGLDPLTYDTGARVTIGRIRDCLDGWELSYTGGFDWSERSLLAGPNLNPKFAAPDLDISAFRNAQQHSQEYRSDFHSGELNRRWWGWDVLSTSLGMRYIYLGDKYRFDSLDLAEGKTGTFKIDTDNNLIGPQLGVDLYRPLGRWSTGLWSKAGIYANFVEGNMSLVNDGVTQFANGDDDNVQFAVEAEIGAFVKLQLTPRMSLQAGYELWYLYGVATATSQTASPLTPASGTNIDSEDDIFYHGASLGAELVW